MVRVSSLWKLTQEEIENPTCPITVHIMDSIKNLPTKNTAGLGGFTFEFLQTFWGRKP